MTKKNEIITRSAVPSDAPALRALYQTVFGDDDGETDLFFKTWFEPELAVVADHGDIPVAAAFILPVGELVLPEDTYFKKQPGQFGCGMLYAIGTLPEYRGRGFGEAVTRAAAEHAAACGYPAVVLRPAEPSLFEFYASRCGFQPFFEAAETAYTALELKPAEPLYTLRSVSPSEYRQQRQACLQGSTYIDMSERSLWYQQQLSATAGGGLYAVYDRDRIPESENPAVGCANPAVGCANPAVGCANPAVGCVMVERSGGLVEVMELLLRGEGAAKHAMAAVAAQFPAAQYRVRTLCDGSEHRPCKPFGMIIPFAGIDSIGQTAKWYGPAFD
jgi:GNAT superfamily N-acetyltransferase